MPKPPTANHREPKGMPCGGEGATVMGFAIAFAEGYMVVRFKPGTVLTREMALEALHQQRGRPENQTINDIWDTRGCRADADFNSADVISAVEYIQALHSAGYHQRTALVVDSDESYGVSRIFQALGEGLPYEIQIFRDMESARTWIRSPT